MNVLSTLPEYQKILGIPLKKGPQKEISYLKADGVRLLLEQIPVDTKEGLRDYLNFPYIIP